MSSVKGSVGDRIIRALVVDDEPLARQGLRIRLEREPGIEVSEAASATDAVVAISADPPDLLFLDIEMPELNGFDVLASVAPERRPVVIFVTAFSRHALKAFEARALDYLLKPIDDQRLRAALAHARERLRQRLARETSSLNAVPSGGWLERLAVKSRRRVAVIQVGELDWLEADGDYVVLHHGRRRNLLRATLSSLEKRLDPKRFLRIHRGVIINLERLHELRPLDHGEYQVHLKDGTALRLSRTYRERLRSALGAPI